MDIKSMSDQQLHSANIDLAERQRKITLDQLDHLNETESRRLFSKFSCDSLHAYCVKELKMDGGTASRYVSAARLLVELPEVKERIISGSTHMTSVAQAGVFFRKEEREGEAFDLSEKRELLDKLDEKTTREVDRILISESSNPEIHFKEKLTPKSEALTEAKLHFDEATVNDLERLKEIWSHAMPHASFADLIKRALSEAVERHDRVAKAKRSDARSEKSKAQKAQVQKASDRTNSKGEAENSAPAPVPSTREVKREVWMRDGGFCGEIDPRTGEICGSRHFVEEDHILPKAIGGEYTVENIRLRCRAHNQRHAINCYGEKKMRRHLN